jgi:5-methyltetrahydrofolate--homocysteine methyltransferase
MTILMEISEALQKGQAEVLINKTQDALGQGIKPEDILNKGLLLGMGIIGTKFKNNEVYVPEVLIAARAMNASLTVLEPKLKEADVKPIGKVVLGTVKGDLHDIGKNLVSMMMVGAGLEVIDVGIDVSTDKFLEAIKTHQPQVLALSCLLTTTIPELKANIEVLEEEGLRDKVKVLIGGAPVTQKYADDIGADGYAPDAASAAETARQFILGC